MAKTRPPSLSLSSCLVRARHISELRVLLVAHATHVVLEHAAEVAFLGALSRSITCHTTVVHVSVGKVPRTFVQEHLANMSFRVAMRKKTERADTESEGTRTVAGFCETLRSDSRLVAQETLWCCALRVRLDTIVFFVTHQQNEECAVDHSMTGTSCFRLTNK